ncbi:hypothetical protein [Burkholderia ubonensis]|nr:hypothetical protein [Burkholderia ubonensis]
MNDVDDFGQHWTGEGEEMVTTLFLSCEFGRSFRIFMQQIRRRARFK